MSSNEKLNEMLHIMMDNILEDFQTLSDENNAKIDEMQVQIQKLSEKLEIHTPPKVRDNTENIQTQEMLTILNKNILCMNTLLTQIHNKISETDSISPLRRRINLSDEFAKKGISYKSGSELSDFSDVDQALSDYKIEQNLILEHFSSQIILYSKDIYIVCNNSYIDKYNITKNGNVTLNNDGCEHWMISRNPNDSQYFVHDYHTINCLDSHYSFEYIVKPESSADFVWNDNTWCNHPSQKRFVMVNQQRKCLLEYNYKKKSHSSLNSVDICRTPHMVYSGKYIIMYNDDHENIIFNVIYENGISKECAEISRTFMEHCKRYKSVVYIDSVCIVESCFYTFVRYANLHNKRMHEHEFFIYCVSLDDLDNVTEYNTKICAPRMKWNENNGMQVVKSKGKTRIISCIKGDVHSYINSENILSQPVLDYLDVKCNDYNNELKSMDTDKTTSQEIINKLFTSEQSQYESVCIFDQFIIQMVLDSRGHIAYMKSFKIPLFYPIMNVCSLSKNKFIITSFHEKHSIESLLSHNMKYMTGESPEKKYKLHLMNMGKWNYEYFY